MAVLGIIPARGGSKAIPGKNIRLLCGKPLMAYSIDQARNSKRLDYFIVTTDDNEVAKVAKSWGADILMRPASLAQDETPMMPVIEDVLARLDPDGNRFDILTLLQPTCPFRNTDDIDSSIALLLTGGTDAVVGVCRVYNEHPAWMFRLEGGWLQPLDTELSAMSRQELPPVYRRNGVIYTIRRNVLEREHTFWPKRSIPYIMPKERSINIDEPIDWLIAEKLMAHE